MVAPTQLRLRGCAYAPIDGFAPSTAISRSPSPGGPSTGGDPRPVPRRLASPLPSSTFDAFGAGALEVLPTGVRRHTKVRVRDPPDLDADFSVTSRSMRSGLVQPDFLSWGCPKIAPPSFRVGESVARAARLRASLRRRTASPSRVPSSWFRTTSTVCSSSTVQVCFALLPILGFAMFPLVAKRGFPQRCSCPSKPSLRRQRRSRHMSVSVGSRHRPDRLRFLLPPLPTPRGPA